MKRTPEELIEEISDFLIVYMKTGKLGINSFIHKAHLQLSQLEQLLQIHFLLKEEVKVFVRELPFLIRRFKTSTTVNIETYHGEIRGQINWNQTIKDRLRMNASNKTIFSVNERNRNYDIPENLVLKEFLHVLYNILYQSIDVDHFKKYDWFSEWGSLKKIVSHTLRKNIYLSRVNLEWNMVTDRMIQATTNHRHPLYRKAAELLSLYRKLFSENMDEELFKQLLRETFVFPEKEEVLFELYWVVQLIKHNSKNAELRLIDGRDNLVASWSDVENTYYLYHDSAGSNQIHFHITVDEMKEYTHPFIDRKVESMNLAVKVANECLHVARDGLDAARDVDVALAGPDGVEGVADRLQRRGAEPVDGGSRDADVQAREQGGVAGHVVARLAHAERTPVEDVDDLGEVDVGVALDQGLDRRGGEVVGADVLQRALDGTSDRRPDGVDDDGFGHGAWSFR